MANYPVILSFDVGVIHLAYCLLTKKEFTKEDGTKYIDWSIIDWNNIDLTDREQQKCECGLSASVTLKNKYYCKKHAKKVDINIEIFEEYFNKNETHKKNNCCYEINTKLCGKKSLYCHNLEKYYCTAHAKQLYKKYGDDNKVKQFKTKDSKTLNFDDIKYKLYIELDKKKELLNANHVVIENQPSFKNPRMKSIACSIYDYYLIRGIIDKNITGSKIQSVKFMAPSNKLKLADEGDTKELIKVKNDSKSYKLTKALGIKYCLELTKHLKDWTTYFNSYKKKDDLADAFLQGIYFYNNNNYFL